MARVFGTAPVVPPDEDVSSVGHHGRIVELVRRNYRRHDLNGHFLSANNHADNSLGAIFGMSTLKTNIFCD
jgi:hypothetical protein